MKNFPWLSWIKWSKNGTFLHASLKVQTQSKLSNNFRELQQSWSRRWWWAAHNTYLLRGFSHIFILPHIFVCFLAGTNIARLTSICKPNSHKPFSTLLYMSYCIFDWAEREINVMIFILSASCPGASQQVSGHHVSGLLHALPRPNSHLSQLMISSCKKLDSLFSCV